MQIEFTARGILATLFRQRRKTLGVFLLIFLGGFTYALLATPLYEARGSLLVKFGQNAAPDLSTAPEKATELSQNDRREIMQSNLDLMQSHDMLLAVVQDVGAERIYPGLTVKLKGKDSPDEAAIRMLSTKHLAIKSGIQSNLIEISALNADPAVAKVIVERLIALYIARQSQVYNKAETGFMAEQVANAEQRLSTSQARLQAFKSEMGISSFDEEMNQLLKDKGESSKIAFQALDDVRARIAALEMKQSELLMTYKPGSAPVRSAQSSLALARRELAMREADLKAGSGEGTGVLATRLASIDERIKKLEAQRSQYNDLDRQVRIDEENYKTYKLRNEDARVNDTLNQKNITRITVVDEPIVGSNPARPRRKLIVIAAFLAACIFSVGIAAIFETLDERFGTPAHLAYALRVPVMASFGNQRVG